MRRQIIDLLRGTSGRGSERAGAARGGAARGRRAFAGARPAAPDGPPAAAERVYSHGTAQNLSLGVSMRPLLRPPGHDDCPAAQGADLRIGGLRHHHGVRRAASASTSCRTQLHILNVAFLVPRVAARIRRLRRQHRLQPALLGDRGRSDGDRGARLRALPGVDGAQRAAARARQGGRRGAHRPGLHHDRPRRQPDHGLPSRAPCSMRTSTRCRTCGRRSPSASWLRTAARA